MGRVFLSGPWTAPTEEQRAALLVKFQDAQAALTDLGMDVVNPVHHVDHRGPWPEVLRARLRLMLSHDVDTVALLEGWSNATDERDIARKVGMRCTALCILLAQP